MSLTAFQYMILADLSYYNHEFREDGRTDNDNEDYPNRFYMSINNVEANSTFGAITNIQGLSGWQEFTFDQNDFDASLSADVVMFDYDIHVKNRLAALPQNAGYSFDRSGLDAKMFVSDNNMTASNVEVVIAFGGTDPGNFDGLKDVEVDIALSRGEITDQAIAAIYYTREAIKALDSKYGPGNYTIEFTGHSLGGNVASTVASYFGGEAHVFNSAPQTDQVIDASTPDGMSTNAISAYEDKFPALALNNFDLNQVNIHDYHLTNDALRTMSRVEEGVAQQISDAIDNYTAPFVLGAGGLIASVSSVVPHIGVYLSSGIGIGSIAAIKLLGLDTLDTEPFGPGDYFTNYANYQSGQSGAIDLGASVPFEVFEGVVGDIIADPKIIDVASAGILYNMALSVVNLHLGGQLLFMLDNQDFSTVTGDEQLPWFWVEAFNNNTTAFKSSGLRVPDAQGETQNTNDDPSLAFFKELERTKINDPNGDGNVTSFKSQITLLADVNLDNLILADGSNIDRAAYNVIETVVQRAIMQHTRNQMDDHTPDNVNIITEQSDGLLTVDISLLDENLLGVENYQVESLLASILAVRDQENLSDNAPIIQNSILLEYEYIYGLQGEKDTPIIKFINSGEVAKLYLDGSDNTGVDFVMDQMEMEQTITITGGGVDTIETNKGSNLIFSGAGDDVIIQHIEKSSAEAVYGDRIYAGQGSDTIYGSYGYSYIDGVETLADGVQEIGTDTIDYSGLDVSVFLGPTSEYGIVAKKGFSGAYGADVLKSIENYLLTDQADTLYGYDGLLDETTKIDGGAGFDVLDFSLAQNGVTVDIGNSLTVSGFEEVIGTSSDDIISGDSLANRLFGNNGTDYIYANGGNDTLVGGGGSDFLYGGTGSDSYHFSKATEHPLWQQTGSDFISDSGGLDDQIIFSGGYQFNPTDFSVLGGALIISTDITVDVADQIENIIYSDGAHYDIARLINDEGAATTGTETDDGNGYSYLDGDASSNSLNATFSTGTINGYAGDDWLYSSSSQNLLLGGDGSDYLFGAGLLDGEDGNDYLDGLGYDDVIYAKSSGIDVIRDAGTGGNLLAAQIDEYGVEVSLQYTLWKADNGSLVLDFSLGETSEDVFSSNNKTIILDQFNGGGIEFINGNAIDFSVVRHLSFEADGVLAGTSGIDIIAGGQGNDLISAGALDEIYVSEGKDKVELSSITEETYTVYFPDGTTISDIVAYRDVSDAETINFVHDQGEIGIAAVVNPPTLDFASGGTREVNDFTLLTDGSYEDDEITDFIYSDHLGNLDTARSQDDVIYGRGGDDEITVFNGGVDFVYGGDGDDVIAQYELPNFSTSGSVFFYGEDGNDTLTTLTIAGELYGGDGDDILVSNDMTDKLDGGSGNDWISAGNGSDDIYGGDGNDIIVGLVGGTKTVAAGAGNDLVVMDSTGDDVVSGGDGFDTISFEGAFGFSVSQIDLSLQTAIIDSASYTFLGFEGVIGSYGNDTIIGTVDSNVLDGGTGFVEGFEGNDFLSGGAGSDKYVFGTPYEVRIPPNQTPPANNLTVLVGDDVISDSEGERDAIEFTEYITLSSMVFAQNNDDLVITFDEGSITIQNHFTDGKIEDLLLSGGTRIELDKFSSWLIGTDTDDTLNGSSGNDVLSGGMGNNTLNGGSGNDTYLFNIGDGTNTITDSAGFDIISLGEGLDLSDITFSQVGNDLDIQIASGFLVKDFYSGDTAKIVEELRFADGSTFDLTSLLTTTPESSDAINTASTGFYSYNGSQDKDGMINLIDSATGVELNGNVWKKIAIEYTVTTNTVISFEYKSTIEGELQGFGLETDDDYATGASTYQLYGTDSATNFSTSYTYSGSGDWEHFTIDVGSYQTGDVDWLTFVNDHDGGAKDGNSFYKNIVLYERDPGTANIAPQAVADEFEALVNTAISGNLFADNFHGQDFDVDSDVINAVAETIATTNGSVVISTNGDFTYTPDTGFSGTDSFIYTVEDGNGGSDTVTATLFIGSTDADQTFTTSSAFEHYNGGAGIDTVDYSTSATRVKLNIGAGIGWDGDANDDTYVHIENVIGTDLVSTGDTIYGSEAENYIFGLAGNDVLEGMGGADTIDGGGGSDYASYSRSDSSVTVNLETGIHTGGDAEGDTLINIEKIIGSDHNDILTGNAGGNIIKAGKGDDILSGGEGNDTLQGDYGSDTYIYTSGHDSIDERGTGTDTVVFDAIWSPDDVVISGNTLTLQNSTVNYISFDDINLIEAFEFDGYAPMDLATLQTFGAPIQVTGTSGDDTFVATSAAESFDGYSGTDTVDYSNSVSRVKLNLESGTGWNGDAIGDTYIEIENVIGTDLAGDRDFIYGNSADNYIFGLAGNDVLEGKAGADTIDGGAGSDYSNYISSDAGVSINLSTNIHTGGHAEGDNLISIEKIEGSNYNDVIIGSSINNTLIGHAGNDEIRGGDGSDYLYGGNDDDLIYGDAGVDMLYGEFGADTFIFEAVSAFSNSDNIQDFDLTEGDKLDVSDLLIGYDSLTDAITDFVQITESSGNSYLNVDADGGADNFVQVAYIYNETGLTDEDALETSGNLITV